MSVFFDALNKAQKKNEDQNAQKNVIQVPRRTDARDWMMLVGLFCLLATGFSIWSDRQESRRRDQALHGEIATLGAKQEELLAKIHTDDSFLDTRMQLDVLELKQNFKALSTKFDSFRQERESIGAENKALREELKSDMVGVSTRLHNVERDHSILAERMETLKTERSGEDPSAA